VFCYSIEEDFSNLAFLAWIRVLVDLFLVLRMKSDFSVQVQLSGLEFVLLFIG
jgi:hypothetical protein